MSSSVPLKDDWLHCDFMPMRFLRVPCSCLAEVIRPITGAGCVCAKQVLNLKQKRMGYG